MKRTVLSLVLIVVMMFSVSIVSQASEPTIELESRGVTENTLKVDVILNDNPGIIVMRLKVMFNTDALKLKNITDKAQLGEHTHTDNLNSNDIYLYWSNPTATSNYTFNGTVATLEFDVIDASKKAEISLLYDVDNYDIINFDLKKVDFKTNSLGLDLSSSVLSDVSNSSQTTNNQHQGLDTWFYIGVGVLVILIATVVVMIYVKKRDKEDN